MAPLLRRTWAPRSCTPAIAVRARRYEKVSGIGALAVSPQRRRLTLGLALHVETNIRGPQVRRFLSQLHRHLPGPVILLWDQGKPHKHRVVHEWLHAHRHWHVVWFPPYAPDLNPVEQLWTYLKYGRLANFAPAEVTDVRDAVRRERQRLRRHPTLLKSFFHHSALPFRV